MWIDDQTGAGLVRWLESFDQVSYFGVAADENDRSASSVTWVDVRQLSGASRLRAIPLPRAYRIELAVLRTASMRRQLAEEIRRHQYLSFVVGGLFGDWGALAALEAIHQGRKYACCLDAPATEQLRRVLPEMRYRRRIKEAVVLPVADKLTRWLVKRSAVGLLQGSDTYNYYKSFSANPTLIYDTHTSRADAISVQNIKTKTEQVLNDEAVRICYVGRAISIKGPLEWIETLGLLDRSGVEFEAVWLGDGPMLPAMKEAAQERGLADRVSFRGFIGDRKAVLEEMRRSHIFLFCHKVPESPRCLVEALVSGCPIVGFECDYASELVREQGGGEFVPVGDSKALASSIARLVRDRKRLADLITSAAQTGRKFDEESVYRHRADTIKRFS
ncbi:glycosyltransferase [Rhodoplanes sp. P11]|uniref:glycosyltransferase n=1 Tax=Rhodoplanes sp. P11 TaxID=3157621 RepID=UPI0013EBB5E1